MLTLADGFIFILVFFSAFISWIRGFAREILSLLAWVGAFVAGFTFSHRLGEMFSSYIKMPSTRTIVAFFVIFLATFILISLVNFALSFVINRAGLSSFDRLCGAFLGAVKGILVVGLILLVARLSPLPEDTWWKNSFFIPKFVPVENWLRSFMPEYIEKYAVLAD